MATVGVRYLVVAGGGGGGSDFGGGGGGGGFLAHPTTALTYPLQTDTAYTITVGAGGATGSIGNNGANGSNSVLGNLIACGGGGGGGWNSGTGQNGGSGGGGTGSGGAGGSGVPGQGFAGGSNAGGGGGATAVGANGNGGAGGAGSPNNTVPYITQFSGGGGGGACSGGTLNNGGLGGGGSGAGAYGLDDTIYSTAGAPCSGGGGGGGGATGMNAGLGAAGGGGIVALWMCSLYNIVASPGVTVQQCLFSSNNCKRVIFTSGTGTFCIIERRNRYNGTFSNLCLPNTALNNTQIPVEFLVVGGGGAGGAYNGGGGGGGGVCAGTTKMNLAPSTIAITIGAGGEASVDYLTRGGSGTCSRFGQPATGVCMIADRGAAGGTAFPPFATTQAVGCSAATGGGTSRSPAGIAGGLGNTPARDPVQGYDGGASLAGGGGGAGGAGCQGTPRAGVGGPGRASSITGTLCRYGGGGGGGDQTPGSGATLSNGGLGGGGNGGTVNDPTDTCAVQYSQAGAVNTGGGGGAGGLSFALAGSGANGGSGVIIMKYPSIYCVTDSACASVGTTICSGSSKITTFNESTSILFHQCVFPPYQ